MSSGKDSEYTGLPGFLYQGFFCFEMNIDVLHKGLQSRSHRFDPFSFLDEVMEGIYRRDKPSALLGIPSSLSLSQIM
jgi:hypothetical protein